MFIPVMRKCVFILLIILIHVGVAKAEILSCAERLNQLALKSITDGEPCENCTKFFLGAVRAGPTLVTIMVNWVSTGAVPIQNLNSIQEEAKKKGVEILSDFSSQLAFSNLPSDPRLLTTLVFQGNKTHIAELFENLEGKFSSLINFEILNDNDLDKQMSIERTSMDSDKSPIIAASLNKRVLSMSSTEFVARRGIIFGRRKFNLSPKTPAFRITLYGNPYFVIFYPKYFDLASQEEILSTYKALGQIAPGEKTPKSILAFISSYKFGRARVNTFLNYSLSDFRAKSAFKILAKSYDSERPIVATQLASMGTDDEMILIPVVRK